MRSVRFVGAVGILVGGLAGTLGCPPPRSGAPDPLDRLPPAALTLAAVQTAASRTVQNLDVSGSAETVLMNQWSPAALIGKALSPLGLGHMGTGTTGPVLVFLSPPPHDADALVAFVSSPAVVAGAIVSALQDGTLEASFPCAQSVTATAGACGTVPGSCTITARIPAGCLAWPTAPDGILSFAGTVLKETAVSFFGAVQASGSLTLRGVSLGLSTPTQSLSYEGDGLFQTSLSADLSGRNSSYTLRLPSMSVRGSNGATASAIGWSASSDQSFGSSMSIRSSGRLSYTSATSGVTTDLDTDSASALAKESDTSIGMRETETTTYGRSPTGGSDTFYARFQAEVSTQVPTPNGSAVPLLVKGSGRVGWQRLGRLDVTVSDLSYDPSCFSSPVAGSLALSNGTTTATVTYGPACTCDASVSIGGGPTAVIDGCAPLVPLDP